MRLRTSVVLLCIAAVLVYPAVADARPKNIEDGFKYFSELCLDNFPSVEKMENSVDRIGWKRIQTPSNSERQKPFFTEMWLTDDGEFILLVRNLEGRIWCTIGFAGIGELPIGKLSSRYSLNEDKSSSDKLSGAYDNRTNHWIFSVLIEEKKRYVSVSRNNEPLASGEFSHDLTITDTPPL
jgi:hypothetical protein